MDLSIVLVNWNTLDLLRQCLQSIEGSRTTRSFEVLVVDNTSTDGSREWIYHESHRLPWLRYIFPDRNLGFGRANNVAIPECRGRYVLFLNTDTIVLEPFDALIAEADRLGSSCGALGGRVLNQDGTIQLSVHGDYTVPAIIASYTFAIVNINTVWSRRLHYDSWNHQSARDVGMIVGCYMLVPAQVLAQVGGFDPQIFMYYEDTDLSYRIRRTGYVVRYTPVSTIIHLGGGSSTGTTALNERALSQQVASARYFVRKYRGWLAERAVTSGIGLFWLVLMVASGCMGWIAPKRSMRTKMRQRAWVMYRLIGTLGQKLPNPVAEAAYERPAAVRI